MYVTKVEIEKIRSISKLSIDFKPPYSGWHVIIGDNGAGKSSVLKSIALALIGPDEARGLRQDWSKWIKINSESAEIKILIKDDSEFDLTRKRSRKADTILNGIRISQSNIPGELIPSSISLEPIRDPQYPDGSDFNWNWGRIGMGWFSAAFGPFRRFTGGNKELEKFANSNPKIAAHLSAFGEDVALSECTEWLKQLRFASLDKHSRNSSLAQRLLNNFVSFINNGDLLPDNTRISKVTSDGVDFIDGNNFEISINDLSDGYRSILSMTFELVLQLIKTYGREIVFKSVEAGIMQIDVPGVVLIDEIDAHLHPRWQVSIGECFKRLFPRIQFIVTTHSPLICRACEKGSIWRLRAPGSTSQSGEVTDLEKDKLIFGNILDAYGTEIFGTAPVRSERSEEKLERLGELNILAALGKISTEEEIERLKLQKILATDDPTGFEKSS